MEYNGFLDSGGWNRWATRSILTWGVLSSWVVEHAGVPLTMPLLLLPFQLRESVQQDHRSE